MAKVEHGGWGRIEIEDAGAEVLKSSLRGNQFNLAKDRYSWRPNDALAQRLGPKFAVCFDCYRDSAGNRRFVPDGGFKTFIALAFAAGRAIRCERDGLRQEQQAQIEVLWNCYQRVQYMHQKLKRQFKHMGDLKIRQGSRAGDNIATVLPPHLGVSPGVPGWSLSQLTKQGRERALVEGIPKPSRATVIQYGLLAAAERQPLFVPDDESEAIVRLALFEYEHVKNVSPEIVDCVLNRLHRAFGRHENDSTQEFWRWFKTNVFKALANQAGDDHGKLQIDQVKSAMLEIGWRGHRTVARCLETFAQEFTAELDESLTPEEQALFAASFNPQTWLGGLPLVMLLDRSDFIQPIVVRMWEEPENLELRGVFLRLLNYYEEMVNPRRAADRYAKQHSKGNQCLTHQFPEIIDLERQEKRVLEDSIPQMDNKFAIDGLNHVVVKLNLACSHADCGKLPRITEFKSNGEGGLLELHCDLHGELPSRRVTAEELSNADPFEDL